MKNDNYIYKNKSTINFKNDNNNIIFTSILIEIIQITKEQNVSFIYIQRQIILFEK